MKSMLITGVGGGVGQSVIKSLYDSGYRIVGADGEVLATGLYAVDKAYHIPYASRPDYADKVLSICRAEECSLLYPGLDAELPVLAREAARFRAAGTQVVVSTPGVVAICDDKLATAQFLERNGFPAPVTRVLSEGLDEVADAVKFPMVLKPKTGGARSQGVSVVHNREELFARSAALGPDGASKYVAQEQILGDEYTCGSINLDGRCHGAIVMRRILRDGDTYKSFVVKDRKLSDFVVAVADRLKPFGACNVQLRVRDGQPYVFEFNARCSGTTYCRTLAGFNEPRMIADFLLNGRAPSFDIREITVLRYWNELEVGGDRVKTLTAGGTLDGDGSRL